MSSVRRYSTEGSLGSEATLENGDEVKRTPLPWRQLSVVYLIDMAETTATSLIFPFITQLVRGTGITQGDDRKIGYFTGIILSATSFAEAFAVVPIGMAADRYGRRPFLLVGPLGLAPLLLAFGVSTQYWSLVALRTVQGMFNANITVAKTVVGEIADSSNIADAFPYLAVAGLVGATVGPLIGGLTSYHSTQWPDSYLHKHPYFLPCLITALWSITIFFIASLTLKETLPSAHSQQKRKGSLWPFSTNDPDPDSSPLLPESIVRPGDEPRLPGLRVILRLPDFRIILVNMMFYYTCYSSFNALIPLMWSESIELGGLGWSVSQIGLMMGAKSAIDAAVQVAVIGRLIRKFGARKVHIASLTTFLVSYLSFPVASFFAQRSGGNDWKVLLTVVISLLAQALGIGAFVAMQIIITGIAPSQSSLATMNGLAQSVAAVTRCVGPSFASSLYSLSLQYQLANGYAVYFILLAITACGIGFSLLVPTIYTESNQSLRLVNM